eukprot:GHVR01041820.1.p1 GENE.GHVR01041820.1~~GHVR01041820.1.p1  ORF type:complete len:990 (+),score=266.10 GHVR01041820.1:85-3054(+)
MYIKRVVLDGFKSYQVETVVKDLHRQFNAITGLNGSGKSNILDAICFVLGISRLQSVRAKSMQELIYKCGQSNVDRAVVTVYFDNTDKKHCPIGYESCEEIVVARQVQTGGLSKYWVNNKHSTQRNVTSMFQSIGLNVNNPTFLIMQGHITKVIKMKPTDLMGLLESSAGVEQLKIRHKELSTTINENEIKLKEAEHMLTTSVKPDLEKKKKEKVEFQQWQYNEDEYKRYRSLDIANDIYLFNKHTQIKQKEADDLRHEITLAPERIDEYIAQAKRCKATIEEKKIKINEINKNIEEIKINKSASYKEVSKICDLKKISNSEVDKYKENVVIRESEYFKAKAKSQKSEEYLVRMREQWWGNERNFKAVSSELLCLNDFISRERDGEGDGEDVVGVLSVKDGRSSNERIKYHTDEINTINKLINNNYNNIKRAKDSAESRQKKQQEEAGLASLLERLNQSKTQHISELARLEYYSTENNSIKLNKIRKYSEDIIDRQRLIENFIDNDIKWWMSKDINKWKNKQCPDYVLGSVLELVRPNKDTPDDLLHAIEAVAGTRLGQLVVKTHAQGKSVMFALNRRTTVLPLDSLRKQSVITDREVSSFRARYSDNNIWSPLQLINYDSNVAAAVEMIFGNTLIAKEIKTCERLCWDAKKRCVDTNCTEYNPSGTMAGGRTHTHRASKFSLMEQYWNAVSELNLIIKEKKILESELQSTEYNQKTQEYADIEKRQLDLDANIAHTSNRLNATANINIQETQNLPEKDFEKEKIELEERLEKEEKELKLAKDEIDENSKLDATQKRNKLDERLEEKTKEFERLKEACKNDKKEKNKIELENTDNANLTAAESCLQEARERLTSAETKRTQTENEHVKALAEMNRHEKELNDNNTLSEALNKEVSKVQRDIIRIDNASVQYTHDLTLKKKLKDSIKRKVDEFNNKVAILTKEHPDIAKHKHLFGIPGTIFDFEAAERRLCDSAPVSPQKLKKKKKKNYF